MSGSMENSAENNFTLASTQHPESPDIAGQVHTSSESHVVPSAPIPTSSPSPVPNPTAQNEREPVNNPGIIALRSMFPDYDDTILQSVLQSVGGNQERAIDALLGMSDPDYRSDMPAAAAPQRTLTQEELDEQFARQLALSEQQQTDQWLQTNAGRRSPGVYQPRTGRQARTPLPSAGQAQERPSEFQEQFNKFAESGKKTIGSIFSKVKAKIQEFEQGRPSSGTSEAQNQQSWTPPPAPLEHGGYNPSPQLLPQQHPAAYYDPNPLPAPSMYSQREADIQGYDVSSAQDIGATTQQLQAQSPPKPVTVPPPQTSATLDGGKLGLLPKRPVTLLREPIALNNATGSTGASSTRPHYHGEDSDEDLEYAENPFESESSTGKK